MNETTKNITHRLNGGEQDKQEYYKKRLRQVRDLFNKICTANPDKIDKVEKVLIS